MREREPARKSSHGKAKQGKGPTSEHRVVWGWGGGGRRKVELRCALWELEQWVRLAGACDDRGGLWGCPSSSTSTDDEWSHHRKSKQKGVVMCHCVWRDDGDVEGGAARMLLLLLTDGGGMTRCRRSVGSFLQRQNNGLSRPTVDAY